MLYALVLYARKVGLNKWQIFQAFYTICPVLENSGPMKIETK